MPLSRLLPPTARSYAAAGAIAAGCFLGPAPALAEAPEPATSQSTATREAADTALLGGFPTDQPVIFWSPERDAKLLLRVTPDGELTARVLAVLPERADQRDVYNPDPALRDRRVLGIAVFEGFRFSERRDRWEGGTVFDVKNGKIYRGHLQREGITLRARGFIGISLLGRTESFELVDGPSPAQAQPDEPALSYATPQELAANGPVSTR